MKTNIVYPLVCLLVLSCKHRGPAFAEVKDKDISLQAMPMADNSREAGELGFKVRLLPSKKNLEAINRQANEALNYRMDSCFYTVDGKERTLAVSVQPVANGVKGSYEYLLVFAGNKPHGKDSIELNYQDKYINHHTYRLTLAKY